MGFIRRLIRNQLRLVSLRSLTAEELGCATTFNALDGQTAGLLIILVVGLLIDSFVISAYSCG